MKQVIEPSAKQRLSALTNGASERVLSVILVLGGLVLMLAPLAGQSPSNVKKQPVYLHGEQFPYILRGHFGTLGDRLTKPGSERIVLSGVLSQSGKDVAANVTLEVPGFARLDLQGSENKTLGFDGDKPWSSSGSLTDAEEDLLESIVPDSVEAFFYALKLEPASLRIVGHHFRADDGRTPNYQGPWYDIYEVMRPIRTRSVSIIRHKLYYFDSTSQLLAQVRYRLPRQGGSVLVQVLWTDWQKTAGQYFPGKITRLEDGQPAASFRVTKTQVTGHADDGAFDAH